MFKKVFLESVYPLVTSASILPFKFGDIEVEQVNLAIKFNNVWNYCINGISYTMALTI